MNRRRFVQALIASAAATQAGLAGTLARADAVERTLLSGVISDQVFILTRPLVVAPSVDLVITRCLFKAGPDFAGDVLLDLREARRLRLTHCLFIGPQGGMTPRFNVHPTLEA